MDYIKENETQGKHGNNNVIINPFKTHLQLDKHKHKENPFENKVIIK